MNINSHVYNNSLQPLISSSAAGTRGFHPQFDVVSRRKNLRAERVFGHNFLQAQPVNVPTSFKQRAMLVDEILRAAIDNASDIDWYAKRTILGGIYSTIEIYMLTDTSPDFRDTSTFLDARVNDAFDLEKTLQEAQHLAEVVSAGLGNSFHY